MDARMRLVFEILEDYGGSYRFIVDKDSIYVYDGIVHKMTIEYSEMEPFELEYYIYKRLNAYVYYSGSYFTGGYSS